MRSTSLRIISCTNRFAACNHVQCISLKNQSSGSRIAHRIATTMMISIYCIIMIIPADFLRFWHCSLHSCAMNCKKGQYDPQHGKDNHTNRSDLWYVMFLCLFRIEIACHHTIPPTCFTNLISLICMASILLSFILLKIFVISDTDFQYDYTTNKLNEKIH